jgi:hypothetical protein
MLPPQNCERLVACRAHHIAMTNMMNVHKITHLKHVRMARSENGAFGVLQQFLDVIGRHALMYMVISQVLGHLKKPPRWFTYVAALKSIRALNTPDGP